MASAEIGAALNQLIHEMSSSLSSHLMPALEEMKHKFDAEEQKVQAWANDVQHALEETHQEWKAFAATAMAELQSVDTNVEATLPDVEQNAHQYDAKLAEAEAALQDHGANYAENVSHLTEHMGSLTEHHVAMEHEVDHHVSDWTGNINTLFHNIDEHRNHLNETYEHVTQQVTSHVEDIAHHIGQASGMVNEQVSSLVTGHVGAVTELLSSSKDHLLNNVGEALGGAMGESMGALEGFMHVGEELGQAFDGGLGDVLGVVEHVAGIVDSIKPVIQIAEEVL